MKRRLYFRLSLQITFIALALSLAFAQTPERPPQQEKASPLRLGVDLVVVDALVTDRKTGKAVGDLKKEDFTLYEDGVKQTVTHFGQDTLPLSVLLLVDRGSCLDPFSEKVHQATRDAVGRLKPEDEVAVMAFADKAELVQGFRTYKGAITNALDRMPEHREHEGHCFNRAFYEAARYMHKAANPDGRRVIIMVSAITKTFNCPGPSNDEVREALLESGSVVCGIIPKTKAQRLENGLYATLAGMAGLIKLSSTSLHKLAEETGGEVMDDDKPETLDRAMNTLMDHLRTRYTLGFVSTNTKRDGTYRKLKLEISKQVQARVGKAGVITRRGYKAATGAVADPAPTPTPNR